MVASPLSLFFLAGGAKYKFILLLFVYFLANLFFLDKNNKLPPID